MLLLLLNTLRYDNLTGILLKTRVRYGENIAKRYSDPGKVIAKIINVLKKAAYYQKILIPFSALIDLQVSWWSLTGRIRTD